MRGLVISLAAVALMAGACGADDGGGGPGAGATATPAATTGAPSDDAIDICAIVPAGDVDAVLGVPAAAGIDNSAGDLHACSWQGADEPTEVLTISVYAHPDAATAREQYLATTEGLDGVDILNLGDEASYSDAFGLRVLDGRYDIASDNTGPDEKAADLRLAQLVLAALP